MKHTFQVKQEKIIYFSTGLTALQYFKTILSSFRCRNSKDMTSTYHSSLTHLTHPRAYCSASHFPSPASLLHCPKDTAHGCTFPHMEFQQVNTNGKGSPSCRGTCCSDMSRTGSWQTLDSFTQLTVSATGNNRDASLGASQVLLLFPTSTIPVLCLVFPPFTSHREPELTQ